MGLLEKYFAKKADDASRVKQVWDKVPAVAQATSTGIPEAITATAGAGTNFFDGDPRSKSDESADDLQEGFVPKAPGTVPPGDAGTLGAGTTIPAVGAKLDNSRWLGSALGYAFRSPKSGINSLYDFFKAKGARTTGEVYHTYTPSESYQSKLSGDTLTRASSDTTISTPEPPPPPAA